MSPLTFSYRRAEVIAFWIVTTGVVWLTGALSAAAFEFRPSWLWGLAFAITVIAPGAFWNPWFEAGIGVWNGAVRRAAPLLRQYALAVSYYTLFAAVGASRTAIVGGKGSSRWVAQQRDALTTLDADPRGNGRAEWARAIGRLARVTGRGWAITLLPLVLMLRLLGYEEPKAETLSSSYTLY
jgi:hypothetical protein